MKVLHLCGGKVSGGAAQGATVLHKALFDKGIDSELICSIDSPHNFITGIESFFKHFWLNKIFSKVVPRIEPGLLRLRYKTKVYPFSLGIASYPLFLRKKDFENADIIHLHWINAGFISIKVLQKLNKPIIWTMRDSWAYTGGCHYTGSCTGYLHACGTCPMLNSKKSKDITRWVAHTKKTKYPEGTVFVSMNTEMLKSAKASFVLKDKDIRLIPNNIDESFFAKVSESKKDLRTLLKLPDDCKIMLAGAKDLGSPFKGYSIFEKMKTKQFKGCVLVCFGHLPSSLRKLIDLPVYEMGQIADKHQLKRLYYACDIFLAPSRQEAFGKTIAEAGACGLPVISYNIEGPKDIIVDQETGVLVEPFDEELYVQKLSELMLNEEKLSLMGRAASERIKCNYHPRVIADEYIKLYEEVLNVDV